jgi:hypothetical protein
MSLFITKADVRKIVHEEVTASEQRIIAAIRNQIELPDLRELEKIENRISGLARALRQIDEQTESRSSGNNSKPPNRAQPK